MLKVTKLQRENALHFLKMWATVPPASVTPDLRTWRSIGGACAKDLEEMHECGALACAGGWAAADPYFQKQGLSYDPVYGNLTVAKFALPAELLPAYEDTCKVSGYVMNPEDVYFGNDQLFDQRGKGLEAVEDDGRYACEEDDEDDECADDECAEGAATKGMTDHELVAWRFQQLVENSEVV